MSRGVTLHTERLTLRPPRPDDAAWIGCEIARPEVHHWLTAVPNPYGLADAEEWIQANAGRPGSYVIEAEDSPLGVLTLDNPAWGPELGYWLRRSAWGQGVMTEAATTALEHHFAASDAAMPSGHLTDNTASRRVLLKLGFTDTERVSRHSRYFGTEVAVQRMVLTPETWTARHG